MAFVVDLVPVASLAGLLLVVCAHLVEPKPIIRILRSHNSDRVAFVATLFGTFFLHLDEAIYLGVGISLVLFLQRERLLAGTGDIVHAGRTGAAEAALIEIASR